MNPQIISSYDPGTNNVDLSKTVSRLDQSVMFRDLSTVIVIPAFGSIATRVVASWLSLVNPPNQNIIRLFAVGMEVGEAYSSTIQAILDHPEISKFKYILTLEHDNMPPGDGLLKLLSSIEANPEYSAIGGLYFTKGEGGVAQIWGSPKDFPLNFRPQKPDPTGGLVECCGTGMGFTLFKMSLFKDAKLAKPWFKTSTNVSEGIMTQDLYFWREARKHGHRCAIDCSVRVGHYEQGRDMVW